MTNSEAESQMAPEQPEKSSAYRKADMRGLADTCGQAGRQAPGFFARWFWQGNHKDVGTLYLMFAIVAGIVGGAISGLMRYELAHPGIQYLHQWAIWLNGPDVTMESAYRLWNALITAHGVIMIFFMVMPAMIGGFGNWLMPLMIGARDTAFPRMNMIAFWLLVPSFLILLASALSVGDGGRLLVIALLMAGGSSLLSAINFITTIFTMRAPGMTLHKMPLFVWSILVTAFLLLLSIPVLAAAITLLLTDQGYGALFYDGLRGSGADGFQPIFWFFGHPEVYMMILPGFGIISQVVSTFSRKPVFGYLMMAYAMVAIGVVGFVVWAQHMFLSQLSAGIDVYFSLAIVVIALPTAIKLFAWVATMWGGAPTFKAPMLWALGFIFTFAVGGVTGVALASGGPGDMMLDSYYVVAHFHYVLSLGAVFALFAGFYYWFPKMSGRMYNERLAQLHFAIFFVGVNVLFFPMHFLGQSGMSRRIPDYPDAFAYWNGLATWGYDLMAVGLAVFLGNIIWSLIAGEQAGANPWGEGAQTLEWALPSPPPYHSYETLPHIE